MGCVQFFVHTPFSFFVHPVFLGNLTKTKIFEAKCGEFFYRRPQVHESQEESGCPS